MPEVETAEKMRLDVERVPKLTIVLPMDLIWAVENGEPKAA